MLPKRQLCQGPEIDDISGLEKRVQAPLIIVNIGEYCSPIPINSNSQKNCPIGQSLLI